MEMYISKDRCTDGWKRRKLHTHTHTHTHTEIETFMKEDPSFLFNHSKMFQRNGTFCAKWRWLAYNRAQRPWAIGLT